MLDHILDAHGGLAYWRTLSEIEIDMSAWGLLFTTKGIPTVSHQKMVVSTREPRVVIHDYPAPGRQTVFDGSNEPRAAFPKWRWNAQDFAYFSSYAMWNYLNLPFLLREPGMAFTEHPPRITVTFPPEIATHCRQQELTFDADGRLVRHDYTAEVVGGWAKAAHLASNYRQFGGLWLPTKRRVHPRGPGGRPIKALTLVAVDIHDAQPR